uniref:Uncharacterized protein n=1 Tax=Arundo donax TaxID=35708 RepID=A0A0A9D5P6_ARUDO
MNQAMAAAWGEAPMVRAMVAWAAEVAAAAMTQATMAWAATARASSTSATRAASRLRRPSRTSIVCRPLTPGSTTTPAKAARSHPHAAMVGTPTHRRAPALITNTPTVVTMVVVVLHHRRTFLPHPVRRPHHHRLHLHRGCLPGTF